jgi:hypothetical protein
MTAIYKSDEGTRAARERSLEIMKRWLPGTSFRDKRPPILDFLSQSTGRPDPAKLLT